MSNIIRLPNGFRIIYQKSSHDVPISSIYLFCGFGSIHENENIRGIAHFIEHMVFKGTKEIPKPKNIFMEYDKVGAEVDAFTEKEYTCYTIKCNDIHLENSLIVLSNMMFHSTFNKKEFKKEEQVVIEENIQNADDPEDRIYENMQKILYANTPYAYSVDTLEYHQSLFHYQQVIDTYNSYYIPQNMVISIVSNLSFEKIKKIIKKTVFIDMPSNITRSTPYIPWTPSSQSQSRYHIEKKIGLNTTYISIGFRVNAIDKYVLNLLKTILSGPMSSRLFMILREEHGLTYSSFIETTFFQEVGDFTLFTETGHKKLIKSKNKKGVIPLIIQLFNDLLKHGVDQKEIIHAKGYLQGNMNIDLEDIDTIANYNGEQVLLNTFTFGNENTPFVSFSNVFDKYYRNIQKKEVDKIIQTYFIKSNMYVCILGEHIPSLNEIRNECEKLYR
jgi:predicted Zn-dependent peptidase